jgi:hypothetical protein
VERRVSAVKERGMVLFCLLDPGVFDGGSGLDQENRSNEGKSGFNRGSGLLIRIKRNPESGCFLAVAPFSG